MTEITADQVAERVCEKYKIRYSVAKGFVMCGSGEEKIVTLDDLNALMDSEIRLIQREDAEDALISKHEIQYDLNSDRFRVTFKEGGKEYKRIMTRGQFKRFFDTKLKALGY